MSNVLTKYVAEETPPKAGAMINTFRAFGYNLQTAIADILDNSISARAKNVWIQYEWKGSDSWVSITDDGLGMDLPGLIKAMTPGSKDPNDDRDDHDLGRFGLGLKTSSFSQCKSLTVLSKMEGRNLIKRCWDLDFVNETGHWTLLNYLANPSFEEILNKQERGTTIIWEKLDRLVGNSNQTNEPARRVFLEEFELVEDHLSMVFHRYIEQNRLTIWINDKKIYPWDPFMKEAEGGQIVAKESLENDQVVIKCFALPHISKLSAEQRRSAKTEEWYRLQGFYIYRNSRLLLFGDWLGLFQKNEHYKNARILIDIPNSLDHEWKIDIKKATATPSLLVRKDLVRLGKLTRKAASEIHRFRGNQIILDDTHNSLSFIPVWKARKSRNDARYYYINEEHPVIEKLLSCDMIEKSEFKKALKLIGQTTPIESIIQFHSEDPESHELRDNDKLLENGTIELAKMMFKSLKSSGISDDMAVKQIFNIEPFNEYPQLIEYFK